MLEADRRGRGRPKKRVVGLVSVAFSHRCGRWVGFAVLRFDNLFLGRIFRLHAGE